MSKASRRKKRDNRRKRQGREKGRFAAAPSVFPMATKQNSPAKVQQAQAQEIIAAVRHEVQEVRQFSGPLPPPELLREYNEVLPGAAERILSLLEKQTDHRTSLEKKALKDENQRSWGGLIAGLIVALACIGCGTACVLLDYPGAGGAIATASVVGLASVFVIGNRMRARERVEKTAIMTGKK